MTATKGRCQSGVRGLDDILFGGLIAERMYLLDGNPGAGKTTLAMQFLLEGVRAGERCVYVTLSETALELKAVAAAHGWSLHGVQIVELIVDEGVLEPDAQLTMLHASEVELTETTRKLVAALDQFKPERLVVDSLSELRLLSQTSLRYRRQILALKQLFLGRACTVVMLDDRTAEGPDMQLHSIAHGVISLESTTPAYGQTRRELQVRKLRGSNFFSGRHDFTIYEGGIKVFPRLVAAEHSAEFSRGMIASGVPMLDALLGGGIDRGTSTLLIGPPGCGKSTIAVQYAKAAADRGDHAAVFMFDETKSALLTRCAGLGLRFAQGPGPGELTLQQIDPAEVSPGEFVALVRRSVEQDGARVIVIDSLNGYLNSMPQDHFLTAQLHELLSYLSNRGVATFLVVAQSGLMGASMTAPVEASYLADTVIVLRYYEHHGQVKKAISALKKRTGGHEGAIRELWFDSTGIHLSEPLLNLRGVLTDVPVEIGNP
ncbi:MAG: ATPase domain-containing protein, partial [Steroidobacteraceae bacterium]